MASYRFPILVWQDFQGSWTACLVESESNVATVGATAAEAVERLTEYLRWLYRKQPWLAAPDFVDPVLSHARVEVRPEYKAREKSFPVHEGMVLRVACVDGKDSAGMLRCAMPTLGIRFNYSDAAARKGLVQHYVQHSLAGKTPRELSRYLPPPVVALDDVVVHVPASAARRGGRAPVAPALKKVAAVADPIGRREFRRQLSRPWERDEQVARLVETLTQERAGVILVGEGGAGKTAVLVEAARKAEKAGPTPRSEEGDDDEGSAGTAPRGTPRFWMTSAARLIAGMKYLGQWQERVEEVIAELSQVDGVLCVENLLDLVQTGGVGPGDSLAAFLVPYLQRRELRVVAEATPAELDACRRLLPGLVELFQLHNVPPFTREQAVSALGRVADGLARDLHPGVERGTVETTYRLFARFLPYQSFPGRAAAFLNSVFDAAHRAKAPSVTPGRVIERFVRQTGLPQLLLRDELALEHGRVVGELRGQVIGQARACEAAARVITTFKAGLNDPGRPVGVMLFIGPTGVGKTELARAMSRFLFGHGEQADRLLRLDMSEYAGPGAAERLLGDGRGGPSELVQRVRRQPFTVLLLDEIEKAADEVFDVLLGVLDEGRLTDRLGRLTTFRSAVVVMTSNLGAEVAEPFGLGAAMRGSASVAAAAPAYESAVEAFFRPEFFNRIDAVVTFDPLSEQTVRAIAAKELGALAKREGLARANLTLVWTEAVVELLVARGYDRRYGARPLQRAVETLVATPLARFLVEHPGLRDARVEIGVDDAGAVHVARTG